MNKLKVLLGVLVLAISIFVSHANAASEFQADRIELGLSSGIGFYMGQKQIGNFSRYQCYDVLGTHLADKNLRTSWPSIETFGFSLGYRFNTMFQAKVQSTRQRIAFMEYEGHNDNLYCNAMWHTDAMVEYNILPYGVVDADSSGVYNIVPYVGLGIGVTVYNQEASLRNMVTKPFPGDMFSSFPRVGYKQVWERPLDKFGQPKKDANGNLLPHVLKWKKADTGVALYIPIAMGAKWRIDEHWQLKATFQYQLYFQNASKGGLNSNLDGGTFVDRSFFVNGNEYTDLTPGRPNFDYLDQNNKKVVGQNHDFLFSLTAIYNISFLGDSE